MIKKQNKASVGKRGDKIRSDCYFELEKKSSGGIKLKLQSKVEAMYGESIKKLILDMCSFFGINNVSILLEERITKFKFWEKMVYSVLLFWI